MCPSLASLNRFHYSGSRPRIARSTVSAEHGVGAAPGWAGSRTDRRCVAHRDDALLVAVSSRQSTMAEILPMTVRQPSAAVVCGSILRSLRRAKNDPKPPASTHAVLRPDRPAANRATARTSPWATRTANAMSRATSPALDDQCRIPQVVAAAQVLHEQIQLVPVLVERHDVVGLQPLAELGPGVELRDLVVGVTAHELDQALGATEQQQPAALARNTGMSSGSASAASASSSSTASSSSSRRRSSRPRCRLRPSASSIRSSSSASSVSSPSSPSARCRPGRPAPERSARPRRSRAARLRRARPRPRSDVRPAAG